MTMSDYAELKVLDAICNNTSFAVAQVYVKLHTADPGENGTVSPAGETTRQAASFAAAAAGSCATDATITWSNVSTAETYSHVSLWDTVGPAGGNCLGSGALTTPKTVAASDTAQIPSGSLTYAID